MDMKEVSTVCGHMRLEVREVDGSLVDVREARNVMCTAGYLVLVQAMLWSAAADQNGNLGLDLTPTVMAPVYGAIGAGTAPVATTDLQLQSEFAVSGRQVLYAGTSSGPQLTLNFFFPTTLINWTIGEAGIFLQGTNVANAGALLDHALILPTVSKLLSQTLTLAVAITWS
jgi:hypothetical protein